MWTQIKKIKKKKKGGVELAGTAVNTKLAKYVHKVTAGALGSHPSLCVGDGCEGSWSKRGCREEKGGRKREKRKKENISKVSASGGGDKPCCPL